MDKLNMPKFATEAEEAEWLDSHRDLISKRFRQAHQEGKLRFVPPASDREKVMLRPVTIRVSEADIALARKQAGQKGLPYQSYIKSLLHEELAAREASPAKVTAS